MSSIIFGALSPTSGTESAIKPPEPKTTEELRDAQNDKPQQNSTQGSGPQASSSHPETALSDITQNAARSENATKTSPSPERAPRNLISQRRYLENMHRRVDEESDSRVICETVISNGTDLISHIDAGADRSRSLPGLTPRGSPVTARQAAGHSSIGQSGLATHTVANTLTEDYPYKPPTDPHPASQTAQPRAIGIQFNPGIWFRHTPASPKATGGGSVKTAIPKNAGKACPNSRQESATTQAKPAKTATAKKSSGNNQKSQCTSGAAPVAENCSPQADQPNNKRKRDQADEGEHGRAENNNLDNQENLGEPKGCLTNNIIEAAQDPPEESEEESSGKRRRQERPKPRLRYILLIKGKRRGRGYEDLDWDRALTKSRMYKWSLRNWLD